MSRASLVIACCLCSNALASPNSDPTVGRSVFTGATVATASSIDLNPAAIGPGSTDYIYAAASAVLDRYNVRLDSLDVASGAITPGTPIQDSELGLGGTAAIVYHLPGDRATLSGELGTVPSEKFITGQEALAYHTVGGGERTIRWGLGSSIRITDSFYFGLSLNSDATYLHLHYARDTALANGHGPNGIDSDCGGAPCGLENPLAQERYDVNVRTSLFSTSNLVLNLGVLVELAPDMWLGVAYHTPPGLEVETELRGTMDVRAAPRDGGTLLHGASSVFMSQPASADAELRARLRAKLDLHVGLRWEDLSRLQAFDVRGYGSTFFAANIPEWQLRARGFHDPLSAWVGVEQVELDQDQDWLRFGARLGFETSSLPDEDTTPLTISPRSYTLDVGMQLRFKHVLPHVLFQAAYGLQYFPTVDVRNSAFDPRSTIACVASGYDYSTAACTAVRDGYGLPTADGRYDRLEQALRIALIYEFGS